jgi:nicotinamidase-related amidase
MSKGKQAVVIIDMINDFRHESGEELFAQVLPVTHNIKRLKQRATAASVPVIYVNDNFQNWHDTFDATIEHVASTSDEGRKIVELLRPTKEDYYVLKPHRSGFYKTPLGVLLEKLDIDELIVTGASTDMCVLSTAHDAQMRGYKIRVPSDTTSSIKNEYRDQALDLMARVLEADTSSSDEIDFTRSDQFFNSRVVGAKK